MAAHDIDSPCAREAARAVAQRLEDAGHQALFCGGAVRDGLLGREPGDYDVATSARPEATAALFPRSVLVGARFGVVMVPGAHHTTEVATFRDDGIYVDGRRPSDVSFSTPQRDAQRRDFTVNGLFEVPGTGEVLDYVDGRRDLASRLLRAIGDPRARFEEDHLRMLRAVRLAAELRFAIEPRTRDAIRALAPEVAGVSRERVRVELLRLLRAGRGLGLRLLDDTGLLEVVLPEIAAMQGVLQPALYHPEGDVFVHTCLVLDHVVVPEDADAVAADDLLLGALLHDISKPETFMRDETGRIRFNGHDALGAARAEAFLERMKSPRRCVDRVRSLVASHMRFPNLPKMRQAKLRRFLGDPDFALHLELHAADSGASHGDFSLVRFCQETLETYAAEPVLPEPLLAGRDLIGLGYRPGRRLGEALRWVRELQLDGEIEDKAEAVRRVREAYPPELDED